MEIPYDWIPSTTVEWIFIFAWTSLMAFLPYVLFRKTPGLLIRVCSFGMSRKGSEVAPISSQNDLISRELKETAVKENTEESMIPDQKGPDSQEPTNPEDDSEEISEETSNESSSCPDSKEEKPSPPSKFGPGYIPCPKEYQEMSAWGCTNLADNMPAAGHLPPSVDKVYWKSWPIVNGDRKWMVRVPSLPFRHYGKTFDSVYPRGLSLESCEGDSNPNFIHFTSHVVLENGLARLKSPGSVMKTPPIPLYFNHVLYSFKLVAETNSEGFDLSVFCDVGPHLSTVESMYDKCYGAVPNDYRNPENKIKGLTPPDLLRVEIIIFNNKGEVNKKITLNKNKKSNSVFESPRPITKSEFLLSSKPNTDKSTVDFHCEVHIYTKRDHLSLERLIYANTTKFRSDAVKQRKIERILRGEKLDNATWTILLDTKGERKSGINQFYMEETIVMEKRSSFKYAIADGKMKMNNEKKEIILHGFEREDMQYLIPVFYDEPVPMVPVVEKTHTLGRIADIFPDGLFDRILDQYHYEIINRALAIDPSIDSVDSFVELVFILTIIFGVPRGAMSLAKRIAVGVLADMMHLHIPDEKWPNYPDGLLHKISQDAFELTQHDLFHPILHSVMLHRMKVSSVRKEGLKAMPE